MLALFLGVRFGFREVPPSLAVLPTASTQRPAGVIPGQPAPDPVAATGTPAAASAAIEVPEADDRPVRKTRPGPAVPSGGVAHTRATEDHARAEESKEKGILDIGSEPAFAYVAIDGVKVGATPIFGREVTPGAHRIQVWRDGLGSKTFTLEVRPGDRITRVVKLP
jgi:hypothetical protein